MAAEKNTQIALQHRSCTFAAQHWSVALQYGLPQRGV